MHKSLLSVTGLLSLSEPESAHKESGIPGNDTLESPDEALCRMNRESWATKVHELCPKSKKLYQLKMRNDLLSSINQKFQSFLIQNILIHSRTQLII